MQRVRLLGELGELFGVEHEYQRLRHPGDAIKLLCINKPAFKEYLLRSEENGIGFKVIQSDVEMGYEELLLPFGQKELVIAPVITGSGGTVGKVLAGVGLIAFSILTAGAGSGFLGLGAGLTGTAGTAAVGGVVGLGGAFATAGTGFVLGAAASVAIGSIGTALVLSGVADLIAPQPKVPQNFGSLGNVGGARFGSRNSTSGPVGVERALGGQQSYAYTGAANTVGVGATVPVAYGKVLIGSHLLRSKLSVTDESDPIQKSIKDPGPDTVLIGGEKPGFSFGSISGAEIRRLVSDTKTTYKSLTGGASFVTNVGGTGIIVQEDATTDLAVVAKKSAKKNKENFNVILRSEGGLFEYPGSALAALLPTKADAFITYEIKVYRGQTVSENKLIAMDSATIQGLLVPGQKFTWMHKMTIPAAQEEPNVSVQVKIVNTSALATDPISGQDQRLVLMAIGYNLD